MLRGVRTAGSTGRIAASADCDEGPRAGRIQNFDQSSQLCKLRYLRRTAARTPRSIRHARLIPDPVSSSGFPRVRRSASPRRSRGGYSRRCDCQPRPSPRARPWSRQSPRQCRSAHPATRIAPARADRRRKRTGPALSRCSMSPCSARRSTTPRKACRCPSPPRRRPTGRRRRYRQSHGRSFDRRSDRTRKPDQATSELGP